MIVLPPIKRDTSWWRKLGIGLIPGLLVSLVLLLGGGTVQHRQAGELASIQQQVQVTVPVPVEPPEDSAALTQAVEALNVALDGRNEAIGSLNYLSQVANLLPQGVRLISYDDQKREIQVEALQQALLGDTATNLIRGFNLTTSSNQQASTAGSSVYPQALFDWSPRDAASPSPTPAPTTSVGPQGQTPEPSTSPSTKVSER